MDIYFLAPALDRPHGGNRHLYNLCMVADKLGIRARVVQPTLYDWMPEKFWKYWLKSKDTIQDIKEGDIVVSPEIWHERASFNVPVRRIKYIQNYSLATRQAWETIYWSYIPEHIQECRKRVITGPKLRAWDLDTPNGGVWFDVPPMFDTDVFRELNIPRNRNKALVIDRKCINTINYLKNNIGMQLNSAKMLPEMSMPAQYNQVGVLCIPSEAEGCCFPAVEALLCGTAVIGWPCCALETFIVNDVTGVLVERNNNEMLLQETIRLLSDHKRQTRLAKTGKELVLSKFNESHTTHGLLNAYKYALTVEPTL